MSDVKAEQESAAARNKTDVIQHDGSSVTPSAEFQEDDDSALDDKIASERNDNSIATEGSLTKQTCGDHREGPGKIESRTPLTHPPSRNLSTADCGMTCNQYEGIAEPRVEKTLLTRVADDCGLGARPKDIAKQPSRRGPIEGNTAAAQQPGGMVDMKTRCMVDGAVSSGTVGQCPCIVQDGERGWLKALENVEREPRVEEPIGGEMSYIEHLVGTGKSEALKRIDRRFTITIYDDATEKCTSLSRKERMDIYMACMPTQYHFASGTGDHAVNCSGNNNSRDANATQLPQPKEDDMPPGKIESNTSKSTPARKMSEEGNTNSRNDEDSESDSSSDHKDIPDYKDIPDHKDIPDQKSIPAVNETQSEAHLNRNLSDVTKPKKNSRGWRNFTIGDLPTNNTAKKNTEEAGGLYPSMGEVPQKPKTGLRTVGMVVYIPAKRDADDEMASVQAASEEPLKSNVSATTEGSNEGSVTPLEGTISIPGDSSSSGRVSMQRKPSLLKRMKAFFGRSSGSTATPYYSVELSNNESSAAVSLNCPSSTKSAEAVNVSPQRSVVGARSNLEPMIGGCNRPDGVVPMTTRSVRADVTQSVPVIHPFSTTANFSPML